MEKGRPVWTLERNLGFCFVFPCGSFFYTTPLFLNFPLQFSVFVFLVCLFYPFSPHRPTFALSIKSGGGKVRCVTHDFRLKGVVCAEGGIC